MESTVVKPIGTFYCDQDSPMDAPRQGQLVIDDRQGYIQLNPEISIDCLKDLDGFSHIWVIYQFHKNDHWKPLVRPPRGSSEKRGVFATRSPYRPNGIGLSALQLASIEGRKIICEKFDLLNNTPILDIKPYLTYADSFPKAKGGWTEETQRFDVKFSQNFLDRARWVEQHSMLKILHTIFNQLEYEPTNKKIKRVESLGEYYCLSYKTWRVDFLLLDSEVNVFNLRSGYTSDELTDGEDPYHDKSLHHDFLKQFL